ncbi:MAG: lytic transglycosylase domain-containing protein [Rhizobiaceae bacterium]
MTTGSGYSTSIATALALALGWTVAVRADVPVPTPRPADSARVDAERTAGISGGAGVGAVSGAGDVTGLKDGLDELARGDIGGALAARNALPAASLDHKILSWAIALGGGGNVPSADIDATARALSDWPGMATLRKNGERALWRENPAPEKVVASFADQAPQTFEGTMALARALVAMGREEKARAVLSPFWRTAKLEPREEALVIRSYGSLIAKQDHRFRMERMLYSERINSAGRVAGLAGAKALHKAWAAVIRSERNARKLLDAVPMADRSAGYAFAEARHFRRKNAFDKAAAVMLKAPTDADALVDPDAWWIERRVLARELVDKGKMETAYAIVAAHAAESAEHAADAEFHAGWYALRGLDDAARASGHFAHIESVAAGAISRSRAFYWMGRAAEAGGSGDASAYYEQAAAYGTCFYGQLAAAKLGRIALDVAYPSPSGEDRAAFEARESVAAIRRLERAGYESRADILYRNLAEQLESPGELALLATMAETRGDHTLALKIGKLAAARGLHVGALSHPVGAIPGEARTSDAGKALAYAIARQESEFNASAVSGAGARGLLQLLPGTARQMARATGLPYSKDRLTTDAAYNATLGAAFLGDQLGRFDGSYVLTFAGYNAGPGRTVDWIRRYGDPRGKTVEDVVDWIETIPFAETRSYVQRVMENYQVYKMRLSGRFEIARDLTAGRKG